jgi:hypothetical protein
MHPLRFEPPISAGERPQTYTLDRAATGTGFIDDLALLNNIKPCIDIRFVFQFPIQKFKD